MEEMEKLIQQLKEDTLQSDYAQKKLVFGEGKQNAKKYDRIWAVRTYQWSIQDYGRDEISQSSLFGFKY